VTLTSSESGVFDPRFRVTMAGPGTKKMLTREHPQHAVFTDAASGISMVCTDSVAHVSPGSPDAHPGAAAGGFSEFSPQVFQFPFI
jgi:hypothetical protein